MALLRVESVSKSYAPPLPAVAGVDLSVESDEILCLLGPSGCGKTTLLRIIAGLTAPDSGRVWFDGQDVTAVPPHERRFGMMFQDFALFPHKNVFDNVAFGLEMQRLPRDEIARRVRETLDLVELAGFERRDIAPLSGGEQQRVALARALAPGPRLLMLDEPLGALDRALRERLMLDLRAILKRVGMTAIYVTHDQTEVFAVADRLAIMNAGRIEQIAAPEAAYRHPATPFVARFLGFHNVWPGRAAGDGVIETPVGLFRIDGFTPTPGATVEVLARPQAFSIRRIDAADPKPATNQVLGIVQTASFRGRFSQVWLDVNGESVLLEVQDSGDYQLGDRVLVTFAADALQPFPKSLDKGNSP